VKKLLSLILVAITVFALTACGGMTKVNPIKSLIFSDEDYQEAVTELQTYFSDWEGCTLKEISYAGDEVVEREAKAAGVKSDCLIVLNTTFETDGENHENGLEPNYEYKDYTFTFVRDDFTAPWSHKDHGYG